MQFPDFIKRMLGFADRVEGHFNAVPTLAQLEAKVVTLQAQLEAHLLAASEWPGKLSALETERDLLRGQLDAKEQEFAAFKTQAAIDLQAAQSTANNTLAALGVDPSNLPPAGVPNPGAAQPVNEAAKLRAQLLQSTDPKEKYRLAMAIKKLTSPTS